MYLRQSLSTFNCIERKPSVFNKKIRSVLQISLLLLITLIVTVTINAQNDTCSALIQSALERVNDSCNDTGRNQLCYGNTQLAVTARDDSPDFTLESPGDIIDITYIESVQLSSLNLPDEWGIALMKIQANLPDTIPGQAVNMLLFGDVYIEDQAAKLPSSLPGIVTVPANLRTGPSANYGLLGSIGDGEEVEVDAQNADGDWFRIYRSDTEDLAWIFGTLIEIDGDPSTLTVVKVADPIASAQFNSMQTFLFRSGIGDVSCQETPPDGILIQTPKGVAEINLLVNKVDIRLGSTAFLTATPNDFLTITLLEGQATVTAEGSTVVVPAGLRARIPLDSDALAIGPPELVIYEALELAALPINNLDEPFELPEPRPLPTPIPLPTAIPDSEVAGAGTSDVVVAEAGASATGDSSLYAGTWNVAAHPGGSCSAGATLISDSPADLITFEATTGSLSFFGRNVVETSPGVFQGTTAFPSGDVDYNTLTFTSPNTGTWMMSVDTTGTDAFPCKEIVTVIYQLFR